MTTAVLDASAVIALLKGERGASKVASVVAEAVVGVFNQAEVVRLAHDRAEPQSQPRLSGSRYARDAVTSLHCYNKLNAR